MKRFKELAIGDLFHRGISKGIGVHSDETKYEIYQKVSKSQSECVLQVGYGNQWNVGGHFTMSAMSPTWELTDDQRQAYEGR